MSKRSTTRHEENSAVSTEDAPASGATPQAADAAPGAFGDIDKIRNILFGTQSQEINQRFAHLEARLERDLGALKEAVDRRFEAMEAGLRKDKEALGGRLKDEHRQRADAERNLDKEIQRVARSLQENRSQLDEHIAETDRALRAQLDEQARAASQASGEQFEALSTRLEQALAELRHAKTDRTDLANLFDQLATQLRKDE